jgi:hypothetical protein
VGSPAEVGDDPRAPHRAAEAVCELFEHLEPLLAADAAAAADDDLRGVEPNGCGGRLLPASDADEEMLIGQCRRELLDGRCHAGGS